MLLVLKWEPLLSRKNGKRLRKFWKKGWEFRKNGVRFLEVLSRPKLVEKCLEANLVLFWKIG